MTTALMVALLVLISVEQGAAVFLLYKLIVLLKSDKRVLDVGSQQPPSQGKAVNPLYKLTRQVRRAGDR